MPLLLVAAVVAVAGTWWAHRWLAGGRYRRPDEGGPLPRHDWLVAVVPFLVVALAGASQGEPLAAAAAVMLLAPVGLTLVAVDADVHRLPNVITLPAVPGVLGLLTVAAATSGRWTDLRRAALAMLVVGGVFVVVSLVLGSRGIGMGDAKLMLGLAPLLGWHGWGAVLAGVYVAFLLGGLVALTLLVTRRADRSSHLAFGPYLVAGGVIALLVGA